MGQSKLTEVQAIKQGVAFINAQHLAEFLSAVLRELDVCWRPFHQVVLHRPRKNTFEEFVVIDSGRNPDVLLFQVVVHDEGMVLPKVLNWNVAELQLLEQFAQSSIAPCSSVFV